MARYLLIESRDPYEYGDPANFADLALGLANTGNDVTFFMVQNGVLASRQGATNTPISRLAGDSKVTVVADEFSLRERGIWRDRLAAGVASANIDQLVDLLMTDGCKAVWH